MRAKLDMDRMGGDGPSIRYTAVRAAVHSFKDANEALLRQLQAYKEMPQAADEADAFMF